MFFAPPEKHHNIQQALGGLEKVNFKFENSGAQIVYYQPKRQ